MSSYDGDQGDSLDIKPPQAVIIRREKREKREKRDRRRHKSERRKNEGRGSRDRRGNALLGGAAGGNTGVSATLSHEDRRRDHRRRR